ncbi:CD63 antigen-like [Acanthaster planci]|uniref:Tetraspanin n=1 Tax=Acanthaster planci TaxID=133434 RepID=A0A8B7XQ22_ACAPL|nr:CD63 antigen-like [Acanthaster planci]
MVTTLERRQMHRGLQRSRCCSHIVNIVLLVTALGAIGVSVWIFLSVWSHPAREGTLHVLGISYLVSNIVPAALGVVVILVTIVGVCGLCATHRCTLLWYFILLMVAFVLTIAGSIYNFIFYFELKSNIESSLSRGVNEEYGLYGFEEITKSVDSVQIEFECCGSLSYREWRTSEWHRYEGLRHFTEADVPTVPPSCCVMTANGNMSEPVDLMKCSSLQSTYPNEFMYSESCAELIYSWLGLFALILAVACAVLFVIELITVAACAVLFRCLGPVHYEEQKILHRLKGYPDWDKRERHAHSTRPAHSTKV